MNEIDSEKPQSFTFSAKVLLEFSVGNKLHISLHSILIGHILNQLIEISLLWGGSFELLLDLGGSSGSYSLKINEE